jgi:hypothetical protein
MKNAIIKGITLLLFPIVMYSCKRNDDEPMGGKGGNASLRITPQHHGVNIDSSIVYIKYNATDAPATFDDSAKCVLTGGKPVATFSGLKKGNYYFLGRGYDPAQPIEPGEKYNSIGGVPYTIAEETTLDIYLPIVEDGH